MDARDAINCWTADLDRVLARPDLDTRILAMDRVGTLASVLGVSDDQNLSDKAVFRGDFAEDSGISLKLNLRLPEQDSIQEAIGLCLALAKDVTFGEPIPRSIVLELEEADNEKLSQWGLVLYEHFQDEVLDIVIRLIFLNDPAYSEEQKAIIAQGFDQNQKRTILLEMGKHIPLNDEARVEACRWGIGPRLYLHLAEGNESDFKAVLNKLKNLFLSKELFRHRLLQAVRSQQMTPDHLRMGALIHPATLCLTDVSAVGDFEWNRALSKQISEIEANPASMDKVSEDPEKIARFEQRKIEIQRALEDLDGSSPPPLLREKLKCAEFRKEISALRAAGADSQSIAQRQMGFIKATLSEIKRFACRRLQFDFIGSHAFPSHVIESGEVNCFSGPWLIYSLFVYAGFNERFIKYCNANRSADGLIGGHGSLWVRLETGEVMIVDSGFGYFVEPFRQLPGTRREVASEWRGLWAGIHQEPVRFEVPQNIASEIGVHVSFQVMHAMSGFASGHLLHVGNTFLNENNLKAALLCYELGLKRAPRDPDLWFGLGLVRERMGQLDLAEISFKQALAAFDGHQHSRFALARIFSSHGKMEEARELLRIIVEEKGTLYLHPEIVEQARRLLETGKTSLQGGI